MEHSKTCVICIMGISEKKRKGEGAKVKSEEIMSGSFEN